MRRRNATICFVIVIEMKVPQAARVPNKNNVLPPLDVRKVREGRVEILKI